VSADAAPSVAAQCLTGWVSPAQVKTLPPLSARGRKARQAADVQRIRPSFHLKAAASLCSPHTVHLRVTHRPLKGFFPGLASSQVSGAVACVDTTM
jgi:hypothetical protein